MQEGAPRQVVPPHSHQTGQRSILTMNNQPQSAISDVWNMVTVQHVYILGLCHFFILIYIPVSIFILNLSMEFISDV